MKVTITIDALLENDETVWCTLLRKVYVPIFPSVGLVLEMLPKPPRMCRLSSPPYVSEEFEGTYAAEIVRIWFESDTARCGVRCIDRRDTREAHLRTVRSLSGYYGFKILSSSTITEELLKIDHQNTDKDSLVLP
jgi:hypothetical protein